jgi:hypothetical protein
MIKGTCRFHQQDVTVRKEYYTCDPNKKVVYISNYSLYHDPAASLRRVSVSIIFVVSKKKVSFSLSSFFGSYLIGKCLM